MTPAKFPVNCPRCSFTVELSAELVVQGPVTRTCPACGLLFRVGRGSENEFPEDPVYETGAGWYLRKYDGTVLYFPDLKVLQSWASDGMISLTDEISKKGIDWKRVHDLPEFASLTQSAGSPKDSTAVMRRPSQHTEAGYNPEEILTELEFTDPTSGRKNTLYIFGAFLVGCVGTWFLVGALSTSAPQNVPSQPPVEPEKPAPAAVINAPPKDVYSEVEDIIPVTDVVVSKVDEGSLEKIKESSTPPKKEVKAPEPKKEQKRAKVRRYSERTYDKLMSLGNSQLRTNPSKAALTFMKALKTRDATSEARAKLGRAYLRSGNLKDAIHHLEKAIKDNPKYRPALKDLAKAYTKRGSRDDAIRVLKKLRRMVGRHSPDYNWIRQKLQDLGAK